MDANDLDKITEVGVSKLGLEWPPPESIFELRIPRTVYYDDKAEPVEVSNQQQYLDFLYLNVFPLVEQLEDQGDIRYWHILNHGEYLDLRVAIEDEDQMEKVKEILIKYPVAKKPLAKWGTYDDPNLGSRLGCQSLLLLYNAQSRFVREIVRSIYWLSNSCEHKDKNTLISNMIYRVPIYTSHMLLNIFPNDLYYEGLSHLDEAEFRLRYLLDKGNLPQEAKESIDNIREATLQLKSLLNM